MLLGAHVALLELWPFVSPEHASLARMLGEPSRSQLKSSGNALAAWLTNNHVIRVICSLLIEAFGSLWFIRAMLDNATKRRYIFLIRLRRRVSR